MQGKARPAATLPAGLALAQHYPERNPKVPDDDGPEPIRCQLEMDATGALTVTLIDGCAMPEAIDLCHLLVGHRPTTHRVAVRRVGSDE